MEDMISCSGYRVLKTFYMNNKKEVTKEIQEEQGSFMYAQNMIEDINKWLEKIEEEDLKLFKALKKDLFLVILNNKAMVCATK
jgi:hypothetical protein